MTDSHPVPLFGPLQGWLATPAAGIAVLVLAVLVVLGVAVALIGPAALTLLGLVVTVAMFVFFFAISRPN
ncbi:MAG: hypothetical protein QM656_09650 [Paracoccaceae bacterium]